MFYVISYRIIKPNRDQTKYSVKDTKIKILKYILQYLTKIVLTVLLPLLISQSLYLFNSYTLVESSVKYNSYFHFYNKHKFVIQNFYFILQTTYFDFILIIGSKR